MLKTWNVTYQIGTNPARVTPCLTEGDPRQDDLDRDLQKMLGIRNGVSADRIRLIKVESAESKKSLGYYLATGR